MTVDFFKFTQTLNEKKLDPVDDTELDNKFKNRNDKDIDNDGDVDSSDEYLHKRRKKIDKAMDKESGKSAKKKQDKTNEAALKEATVDELKELDIGDDVMVNGKMGMFYGMQGSKVKVKTPSGQQVVSPKEVKIMNLMMDDLEKDEDDPCWDGYVQVGTKMKNGKEVPKCVPMEEAKKQIKEDLNERVNSSSEEAIEIISKTISMQPSVVKSALKDADLDPVAVVTALKGKKTIKTKQLADMIMGHTFGGSIDKKDLKPIKNAADKAFDKKIKEELGITESKAMELGKKAFKDGKPRAPQSNEKDLKKVGGMTKKNMRDFIRGYDSESLKENKSERGYIVLHTKKGRTEVYANSSYEAAKKAAKKWGLKGTSGVTAHLAESAIKENYDYPDYGPTGAAEMAMTQLHFIQYAAEEVIECLKAGTEMPEWYQNKIAKVEGDMEGIHSYMEGKKRKMEMCGPMDMGMDDYDYDMDDEPEMDDDMDDEMMAMGMYESKQINEKLSATDDISDWIKDFKDSDAEQFKGKSDEERKDMAIAAYYDARDKAGYKTPQQKDD